jgi:outer membrane protein
MSIRICLPLLLFSLLALPACQQATPPQKIAVVDMSRIMRDSEPAKNGVKFLESLHADMQEKINAIQERLTQEPDDEAAQKELQSVYMASQQRMQTEQQHVISLLDDVIQRVINTCREQKGYDVIINAEVTAAFSPAVDVTTEVIAEVNKHPLEFKPAADESARNDPPGVKTPASETPAAAPK